MDLKLNYQSEDIENFFDEKKYNIIPAFAEIIADYETPVSLFDRFKKKEYGFLLESISGGEHLSRYSFLSFDPQEIIKIKNNELTRINKNNIFKQTVDDPFNEIRKTFLNKKAPKIEEFPPFYGGGVGFVSYDAIRYIEKIPKKNKDNLDDADFYFLISNNFIIVDHVENKIKIVNNIQIDLGDTSLSIKQKYINAVKNIKNIVKQIIKSRPKSKLSKTNKKKLEYVANFTKDEFKEIVNKAKQHIVDGDIFQVVLSQRFQTKTSTSPFNIYRALRIINPSPYMFYLKFDDLYIIGSSPEILVKKTGKKVEVRPIAGTRKRGANEEEDKNLESELLSDIKELAEHAMLVDLGRNDVGKISKIGTVKVKDKMVIEKYAHVMHIVSSVTGEVKEGLDAIDVFKSCFPAGTVSGAPKIKAMEIIDDLENINRGVYAGSVVYFSYNGDMDSCISIRTIVAKDKQIQIQAGAGIVYDSDPDKEYVETLNKAKSLFKAITLSGEL